MPGDLIVVNERAAGAVERDDHMIADLTRRIHHADERLIERQHGVMKTHTELFVPGNGRAIGAGSSDFEGHGGNRWQGRSRKEIRAEFSRSGELAGKFDS